MSPKELEEISERMKAATPGPWSHDWNRVYGPIQGLGEQEHVADTYGKGAGNPNAHFIAHAPTDIQALLGHISYQDRVIEQMQELTHLEYVPEYSDQKLFPGHSFPPRFRWSLTDDSKVEGREELDAWLRSKGEKG